MTTDIRRFDSVERTVSGMRRELTDFESTTNSRLATHVHAGGPGVTAHGSLTGLANDDHTQYHNDTRGDVRYYTKAQVDSSLSGKQPLDSDLTTIAGLTPANGDLMRRIAGAWAASTLEAADITNGGHEARYYVDANYAFPQLAELKFYLNGVAYSSADVTRTLGTTATGSTFTLNRAGLWLLEAGMRYLSGGTTAAKRYIAISDGTNMSTNRYVHQSEIPSAAVPSTISLATTMRFSAGATVGFWGYQMSGGNLNLDSTWGASHFSLTWLRS